MSSTSGMAGGMSARAEANSVVVIPGSSARSVESPMTVSVVLVDGLKKKYYSSISVQLW